MASNFPISPDSLAKPNPNDPVSSGHAQLHQTTAEAVEAVQNYLLSPTMPSQALPNLKVTNLQAQKLTQFTAKGDIITQGGAGDIVKTPVGADGQVLKARASASGGVAWEDSGATTTMTSTAGEEIPDQTFVVHGMNGEFITRTYSHEQDGSTTLPFGQIATNPVFIDMEMHAFDTYLKYFDLYLSETNNPGGTMKLEIYNQSLTLISTSDLIPDNTTTSAEYRWVRFKFPKHTLIVGDMYIVRLSSTNADNSNYYKVRGASAANRAYPITYTRTGYSTTYTYQQFLPYFRIQFAKQFESTKVYCHRPEVFDFPKATGFVQTGVASGATATVAILGSITKTGVTIGNKFLSGIDMTMEQAIGANVPDARWAYGYQTTNKEKVSCAYVFNTTQYIDSVALGIIKAATTGEGSYLRVETDSNGVPSGTLVAAGAYIYIDPYKTNNGDPSGLNSVSKYAFTAPFTVEANTKVHFVLSRENGPNASSYYSVLALTSVSPQGYGTLVYQNGAWSSYTTTGQFYMELFRGPMSLNLTLSNQYRSNNRREPNTFFNRGGDYVQSWSFIAPQNGYLRSLLLRVANTGTPTGNYTCEIQKNVVVASNLSVDAQLTGSTGSDYEHNLGTSARQKCRQKVTLAPGTAPVYIKRMQFAMQGQAAPSDRVTVRIETDNAGSPSGSLVSPGATATTYVATTVAARHSLKLSGKVELLPGNSYWFIRERTGSLNDTSYFQLGDDNSGTRVVGQYYNGSTWVNDTVAYNMQVPSHTFVNGGCPSGELVSADASYTLNGAGITEQYRMRQIKFTNPIPLTRGERYRVVFDAPKNFDNWNCLSIGVYNGYSQYPASGCLRRDQAGALSLSAVTYSLSPCVFDFTTTPIVQNLSSLGNGQNVGTSMSAGTLSVNFISKQLLQRLSNSFFSLPQYSASGTYTFYYTPTNDGIMYFYVMPQNQSSWFRATFMGITDYLYAGNSAVNASPQTTVAYPLKAGFQYKFDCQYMNLSFYYFQS